MTLLDAINRIQHYKPSRFTHGDFVQWVSQVESMVKRSVIDAYVGGEAITFSGFDRDTDTSTVLFMPEPFDMAYIYYMEAQIHYFNEDIDMYNSAMMMFNSVFNEYKADYGKTHVSKLAGRFRF